jgi:AcrR family transcriptional regulator
MAKTMARMASRNARSHADATPEVPEQTREKILRAALPLLYNRGYRGTTMNAVAGEVGISAAALYWHFSSKRDLCFAAVNDELRWFGHELRASAEEPTPARKLSRFVRTYVMLKLQQKEYLDEPGALGAYRQLHRALTRWQQAQLDAVQKEMYALLRGMLAAGRDADMFRFDDLAVTTFVILTTCEYAFSWVRPSGRLSPAKIADHYKRLVLAMVDCRASD